MRECLVEMGKYERNWWMKARKCVKNIRAVQTPKLKLRLDRFYTNLILSAKQCKCEWINKQATLTYIHIIIVVN